MYINFKSPLKVRLGKFTAACIHGIIHPPPPFENGAYYLVGPFVCHLASCAMCDLRTLMGMVLLMGRWSLLLFRSVVQRASHSHMFESVWEDEDIKLFTYISCLILNLFCYKEEVDKCINIFKTFLYSYFKISIIYLILLTRKFRPHSIFALFTLWPKGQIKTGHIEFHTKDYVRKLGTGQIQDWMNQSPIYSAKIRLVKLFKAVYSKLRCWDSMWYYREEVGECISGLSLLDTESQTNEDQEQIFLTFTRYLILWQLLTCNFLFTKYFRSSVGLAIKLVACGASCSASRPFRSFGRPCNPMENIGYLWNPIARDWFVVGKWTKHHSKEDI